MMFDEDDNDKDTLFFFRLWGRQTPVTHGRSCKEAGLPAEPVAVLSM
jgi:hypothetical protein